MPDLFSSLPKYPEHGETAPIPRPGRTLTNIVLCVSLLVFGGVVLTLTWVLLADNSFWFALCFLAYFLASGAWVVYLILLAIPIAVIIVVIAVADARQSERDQTRN